MKSSLDSGRIAFVQPFGLSNEGGGPRVLRGLLQKPTMGAISVNTSIKQAQRTSLVPEFHVPIRPSFGRLERTRFSKFINATHWFYRKKFRAELAQILSQERVSIVHAIAHSWDSLEVYRLAQDHGLPFALTVHDDLIYALARQPGIRFAEATLRQMWETADLRCVISEELGDEYSRRYGSQKYIVITDGLEGINSSPRKLVPQKLRVYFMGLLHQSYLPNFRFLVSSLDAFAAANPSWEVSLKIRSGARNIFESAKHIKLIELPFTEEDLTRSDMESADVAYLPLPFGREEESFVRYSLSTKMIGYLGSGLPILFHGPDYSAACTLLQKHRAAELVTSLDNESMMLGFQSLLNKYEDFARAGLSLARDQFVLSETSGQFWNEISNVVGQNN